MRRFLSWLSRDEGDDTHVGAKWLKRLEVSEMRQTREFPRWRTPKEIAQLREASELRMEAR